MAVSCGLTEMALMRGHSDPFIENVPAGQCICYLHLYPEPYCLSQLK